MSSGGGFLDDMRRIGRGVARRLRRYLGLPQRKSPEQLVPSALFSASWYLKQYPGSAPSRAKALGHYLKKGASNGNDPLPEGFSSSWYLSEHPEVKERRLNPLVHYATEGAKLGYDPAPRFDSAWYAAQNPDVQRLKLTPLEHYVRYGAKQGLHTNPMGWPLTEKSPSELVASRYAASRPLHITPGPNVRRLNFVTDSLASNNLFGGVATALILAILWSEASGRRLRIVTRHSPPGRSALETFYTAVGIRPAVEPDFAFVPLEEGDPLEVGDDDIFLTMSSWITTGALRTIAPERIAYILQEDERSFYPVGPRTIAAEDAMNNPDIAVIVNTATLLTYLTESGIPNLAKTGISFEPSFATFLRPGRLLTPSGTKRNLFFYARPKHPRNLFDIGIRAIDLAKQHGLFPADEWEVHFAGLNIPGVVFSDGSRPTVHSDIGWTAYRQLLDEMDLALSLMASPHPSYPPLDFAAAGSVVVTNGWPGKFDFSGVSDRVIVAEPDEASLVNALADGVERVQSVASVPFQPMDTPCFDTWHNNFRPVVDALIARFEGTQR